MVKGSGRKGRGTTIRGRRPLEAKGESPETPDKREVQGKSVHSDIGKKALLLYYMSLRGLDPYTTRG
jgi:hypothetical protein